MEADVAVLGIGNVLLGDDAVGPYVAALVAARWELSPAVLLVDAGTPGLDLVSLLSGRRAVVLIDAVSAAAPPGTLLVYGRDELLRPTAGVRQSTHDPALRDTLQALELAGTAPGEVVLVGVVPGDVQTRTGLSPPVQAATAAAADEVARQLARLGAALRPRPKPAAPELWWEAGAATEAR